MYGSARELEFRITDGSHGDILSQAVDFFNSEFPTNSSKAMTVDFFTSKMRTVEGRSLGWLAVAMYGEKVVGTCSVIQKELLFRDKIIQAIEIGDTFTSPDFRRDCHFRVKYPGSSSFDDYLNKSIFGRLATEALDLARSKGIQFVYGVPNQQAKLSWLNKMGFSLVDGGATVRISSPTLSHPAIQNSSFRSLAYKAYTWVTLAISRWSSRNYAFERVSYLSDSDLALLQNSNRGFSQFLQVANTGQWVTSRFLKNIDKNYELIKIAERKSSQTCGYLFFYNDFRNDGFRLLLCSKNLFFEHKLNKLTLPLVRISAEKFFKYENLSMWIECEASNAFRRLVYGFISKPIQVDVVGKDLDAEIGLIENRVRFYNFQYADSDLG
jgi:hypothetical protein